MTKADRLHNTSTADIRAELDQIVSDTAEWMQRAAVLLVELRRRKERHPLMSSNTLRHFVLIADGKLDAAAALAVGGNRNLVRALSAIPLDQQFDYATRRTVEVVERTPDGRDVIEHRHITHLSNPTLDRVFSDGRILSVEEQRQALGAKPNRERVGCVLVDHDESALVISKKHIKPLELVAPLKALGFKLVRIDASEGEA